MSLFGAVHTAGAPSSTFAANLPGRGLGPDPSRTSIRTIVRPSSRP